MEFRDRLKKYMDIRKMKAVELSKKSGVSEASISEYLSGRKEPMGSTSIKLANALEISLDTLLNTEWAEEPTDTKKATLNESGLNPQQQKTMDLLLSLPEKQREEALRYLEYLVSNKDKE